MNAIHNRICHSACGCIWVQRHLVCFRNVRCCPRPQTCLPRSRNYFVTHFMYAASCTSIPWRRAGRSAGTNCRLHNVAFVFSLAVSLSVEWPTASHPATERQFLKFCVNIFIQSALPGGGRGRQNFFLYRVPNSLSAALTVLEFSIPVV
jgi:hypothetical protein